MRQATKKSKAEQHIDPIVTRDLDRFNLDLIYADVLVHITCERLHPFLIQIGLPLGTDDLSSLALSLRPWIREYCRTDYPSLKSAKRRFTLNAKKIAAPIVGARKFARVMKWAKNCWPIGGGSYPGDFEWDVVLHALVHFERPYTKLPRELYAKRRIRSEVEQLYLSLEAERGDFSKRLRRQIKSDGGMTDWESFIASECEVKEILEAKRIKSTHSHQAFCRFWAALNESLTQADFEILKTWAIQEARSCSLKAAHLDLVNSECLNRY